MNELVSVATELAHKVFELFDRTPAAHQQVPLWVRSGDRYELKDIVRPSGLSFDGLPELGRTIELLRGHPQFARKLLVRDSCFGAFRLDPEMVVRDYFIGTLFRRSPRPTGEDLDALVHSKVTSIIQEPVFVRALAPLMRFECATERVDFGDGLTIERLGEDDVLRYAEYLRSSNELIINSPYAIVSRLNIDAPEANERDSARTLDAAVEELMDVLRVFKSDRLFPKVVLSQVEHPASAGEGARTLSSNYLAPSFYRLLAGEETELLQLWADYKRHPRRASLRAAVHRFSLACEDHRIEDRMMNLVIAAEALLLGDIPAMRDGELSYRSSLRAAHLLVDGTTSKRQIFNLFKLAYATRNVIAHGGTVSSADIQKKINMSYSAFVERLEGLVRAGILAVVGRAAFRDKTSTPWDDLVLGL